METIADAIGQAHQLHEKGVKIVVVRGCSSTGHGSGGGGCTASVSLVARDLEIFSRTAEQCGYFSKYLQIFRKIFVASRISLCKKSAAFLWGMPEQRSSASLGGRYSEQGSIGRKAGRFYVRGGLRGFC